jgi:ribonuclease VapC
MAKSYVFDTSVLLAFTEAEEGSDTIDKILKAAKRGEDVVYLSFISFMEIYYVTWQARGENVAKELIVLLESLPLLKVHSTDRIVLSAGRIKANHRLSVADAFIVATAMEKESILVHKDPEFIIASRYVETMPLPFKKRS